MAVELRCPECRAKLRLKAAPDPGAEVECPECDAVFEAPDAAPRADRDAADTPPPPRKKKEKAAKPGFDPKAPRKRKAKVKETNKTLLTVLIVLGVIFLAVVISLLVWFFKRVPAAFELMSYLPPDSTSVQGANLGHVRKYVEFYKKFESNVNQADFKLAGDAAAKAVGASADDFIDYMVTGANPKKEAGLVLKSKAVFDPANLSKLPGAKAGTADGRTYYTVDPIPGVFSGRLRVFAPTNRLVVFCPESVSMGTFAKMIAGPAGDSSALIPARLGAIVLQASKGTAWTVIVFDTGNRPKQPAKDANAGGGDNRAEFDGQVATTTQSAKAFALKTSVRSRVVRFDAMLQFGDSEAAQNLLTRYRDSPMYKNDDASTEPPRYWKEFAATVVQNKKMGIELFSTQSAKTSGDLFILSAEADTTTVMETASALVSKMTGTASGGGGMPGPPGGGMPAPKGGPPAGGVAPQN